MRSFRIWFGSMRNLCVFGLICQRCFSGTLSSLMMPFRGEELNGRSCFKLIASSFWTIKLSFRHSSLFKALDRKGQRCETLDTRKVSQTEEKDRISTLCCFCVDSYWFWADSPAENVAVEGLRKTSTI